MEWNQTKMKNIAKAIMSSAIKLGAKGYPDENGKSKDGNANGNSDSEEKTEKDNIAESKEYENFIWRFIPKGLNVKAGGAFFGYILKNDSNRKSEVYSDLSLVFFPFDKDGKMYLSVALSIGSSGFESDHEIAQRPGNKRLFKKIMHKDAFLKDIDDNQTPIPEDRPDFAYIKDNYKPLLPYLDCFCVDDFFNGDVLKPEVLNEKALIIVNHEQDKDIPLALRLLAPLAQYAKIRGWLKNEPIRDFRDKILSWYPKVEVVQLAEVVKLLDKRKYVVLEGAPGVGKTYLTNEIVLKEEVKEEINIFYNAEVVFTQFHGETTYNDFVGGIKPRLGATKNVSFNFVEGPFIKAIKIARRNNEKKVILIIDEINRANLSNVMGEALYLLEPNTGSRHKVVINGVAIDKLPENLYILATMNTADRSLAVVDFALRRRFAWYKMRPLVPPTFSEEQIAEFNKINEIFEEYATDEELNLQPGQSYFIAKDDKDFKDRLKYELMPLIKEYLVEGRMPLARQAFINYFSSHDLNMFE